MEPQSKPQLNLNAQRLGQELRMLRGQKNLRDFARVFNLTAPGPFSQYETGRRLVPIPLLLMYTELPGADKELLIELRNAAELELRQQHGAPSGEARSQEVLEGVSPKTSVKTRQLAIRQRSRLWLLLILIPPAVEGAALMAERPSAPAPVNILVSEPANPESVLRPTLLEGEASSLPEDAELWFATQAVRQETFNVSEGPCAVAGTTFQCGKIYLGRPGPVDAKKQFKIIFIIVKRDSDAQRAFRKYSLRDKDAPDAYKGMAVLPADARVSGTVVLRRR
jgi:hypothetical protein